jgi:hypothetical protein
MIDRILNTELFPHGAIVLLEDEPQWYTALKYELVEEFPRFQIIINFGGRDCVKKIIDESKSIERITLIIADEKLSEGTSGLYVVKELRRLGYTGASIYSGYTDLTDEEKKQFDIEIPKRMLLENRMLERIHDRLDQGLCLRGRY